MARPTEEPKKHFIGVRLTDSEYERLGENKSEAIRNLVNGDNVKQNKGFVKQNDDFVKQYEAIRKECEYYKHMLNEEVSLRVRPEAQDCWSKGLYSGIVITTPDRVSKKGDGLREMDPDLPESVYVTLKDMLDMVRLSAGKDEMVDFINDLHGRLESGELQIVNGKLKLGYHEIFEVLDTSEVKSWLKAVWNACDEKGMSYTDGIRAVFMHGSKLAAEDIYGDRQ